jgi:hypothetical protein
MAATADAAITSLIRIFIYLLSGENNCRRTAQKRLHKTEYYHVPHDNTITYFAQLDSVTRRTFDKVDPRILPQLPCSNSTVKLANYHFSNYVVFWQQGWFRTILVWLSVLTENSH